MSSLQTDVLATVCTLLALLVGILGIIFPVLPGSLLVLAGLILWGVLVGGWHGWLPLALAAVPVILGAAASLLLTGRTVRERQVPRRSLLLATLAGVVGIFTVPFLGLFVGFTLGLFGAEYLRLGSVGPARNSAFAVVKSFGVGILIELSAALFAAAAWTAVALHFWLS